MTTSTTAPSAPTPSATVTPAAQQTKVAKPTKVAAPTTTSTAKPVAKGVVKKAPTAKKTAEPKTPKAAAPAPVKTAKDAKAKKPKLVRDSFTIPKDEYAVIETLKQRAATLAQPIKKSELLRAGLKVLAGLSDSALRSALQAVPSIKTGRPKIETAALTPTAKASAKSARSK